MIMRYILEPQSSKIVVLYDKLAKFFAIFKKEKYNSLINV